MSKPALPPSFPLARRHWLRVGAAHCALGLGVTSLGACSHRPISRPYPPGQGPDPKNLWKALAPRFQTVRIERAKARQGLFPSVIFSGLAQAPQRLHAILTLKGQELLSLVSNEKEYGLRYNYERGLTPGFYHGRPHPCAVQAFLGVELSVQDLVALLLGGGPQSLRPDEVLNQSWDRKMGAESVTYYEHRRRRAYTVYFRPEGGHWVFVAATGYQYQNKRPSRQWSIRHKSFHRNENGISYPKRIVIETLYNGAWEEIELEIETVHLNVHIETQIGEGAQESEDFNDEEGWENADGSEIADTSATEDPAGAAKAPPADEQAPEKRYIPAVFVPNPSGLNDRGDLCRR